MNLTSSALKSHYLSSILPHADYLSQEQFMKNREFYKPEQFIWNNPHRTSKKIYPYYHQQNEEYTRTIKPKIQLLEMQDRAQSSQSRIRKLTTLRNEARFKFYSRKKTRQELEDKAGSARPRKYSHLDPPRKTNQKDCSSFKQTKDNDRTQLSYIKSLNAYDKSVEQIRNLVNARLEQNHTRTRNAFLRRKHTNSTMHPQFIKMRSKVPQSDH